MGTLTIKPVAKDNTLQRTFPDGNYGDLQYDRISDRGYFAPYTYTNRSILEFDLSEIPFGATLVSATLRLKYHYKIPSPWTDPVGKTVWVYKLTRTDWVEAEATWNSYKTGSNWTAPGGDYVTSSPAGDSAVVPASYSLMTWDVLAIVQDAYGGSIAAEFLIKFETEDLDAGYSSLRFPSKEYNWPHINAPPELVIEYTGEPTVTTQAVSNITSQTATGNGNITDLGNTAVTQHGVCWDTNHNPNIYDDKTEEGPAAATEPFTSDITGLTLGVTYYMRAYAINSVGISYGDEVEFTPLARNSTVLTDPATSLEKTAATLNGTLDDDGDEACACGFEYGETTAYGTTTPTESKETSETFSQTISGLTPGKHYHFRAIATNSAGPSYGSDRGFFAVHKGGNPNIDQRMFQHVERMER